MEQTGYSVAKCGRWLHKDCVEEVVTDSEGVERLVLTNMLCDFCYPCFFSITFFLYIEISLKLFESSLVWALKVVWLISEQS